MTLRTCGLILIYDVPNVIHAWTLCVQYNVAAITRVVRAGFWPRVKFYHFVFICGMGGVIVLVATAGDVTVHVTRPALLLWSSVRTAMCAWCERDPYDIVCGDESPILLKQVIIIVYDSLTAQMYFELFPRVNVIAVQ